MREAVVVASSRTALAKSFRGSFNLSRPDDLAAHCIKDVLAKVPKLDPAEVEDVILGCGQPHGAAGTNVARVATVLSGLPVTVAATTVNRFCSSGLQAIAMAAHQIINEGADAAFGGGVESITMMSRDNNPNPKVQEHKPGIYMVMGDTAEVVAKRYNVSRLVQDEYSLQSQQRTARAQREGFFSGELALKPHFDPTSGQGTVTAGNASQLSDGASATLVMSRERADQLNIPYKLVF